ncbi:MAG: hypothetical protein IT376_03785 [Polyangiaceae bacterium]|nr:hypothetical protein [Polyangiaceae bacterium]
MMTPRPASLPRPRRSRAARVTAALAYAALSLLMAHGCAADDDAAGPGNLLAELGACDTAPLGGEPKCVCCGRASSGCREGSPCAPRGASEACGAQCPADMVCNPNSGSSTYGACQNRRSAGSECEFWGNGGVLSNCESGLRCAPDPQGYGNTCQSCQLPATSCSSSSECCPCAGGGVPSCEEGRCLCTGASSDGGTWKAPECAADSGYPCACTGSVCDDGSVCLKLGGAKGICVRECASTATCATPKAGPASSPDCTLDFDGSSGQSIRGCGVFCVASADCPAGLACRSVQQGRMCLP